MGIRRHIKRVDAVAVQGAIAAALSFTHIHELAEAAGQTGWKAWAYPVSVDLLLIAAWARARRTGDRMAWFWFGVAVTASLGANLATSGVMDLDNPPAVLGLLVAGWPAVALLGGTLLGHGAANPEPAPEPEVVVSPPPALAPEPRALVTTRQAADELGVAPETVRGWRASGRITDHGRRGRDGLVDLAECARLVRT